MSTEAQKRATKKYREGLKRVTIDFSQADAALWENLQSKPNKQRYIKDLIRVDMEKK